MAIATETGWGFAFAFDSLFATGSPIESGLRMTIGSATAYLTLFGIDSKTGTGSATWIEMQWMSSTHSEKGSGTVMAIE